MSTIGRCDAEFQKAVLFKCYDALAAAGFTRYRQEAVDWPLEDGFHCWIGLNTGLQKEYLEINPFIGVHVVPIEKLWNGLKIGKYPGKYRRSTATYALHFGELIPDEPVFRFTLKTDVSAEASRMARICCGVGLNYSKSIASYERLLPLLQERIDTLGAYPERVASCLYLMGRMAEAKQFTEEFLTKKPDYFEGFAIPFLKKLADEEARKLH